MREVDIKKTQYTVSDFLSWQREGALNLAPPFQRRSVWKPDARSYFLDTVVRGLPAPIIYLRQSIELKSQRALRDVVDGQQRLRTILAFVDPKCIKDYDAERDGLLIKKVHNSEIADTPFSQLDKHYQSRILSYELSTHVLPTDVDDREVLEMFARLNATGVKLNDQELRNADYYGEFKTTAYRIAFQQFNRWRTWKVFSDDQISRMKEVELTSDLLINMMKGLTGKSQSLLDKTYEQYDAKLPYKSRLEKRFNHVMDEIERLIGKEITQTIYTSEVHFFSLFVALCNLIFDDIRKQKIKKLPTSTKAGLLKISKAFENQNLPQKVLDAVQRASADVGRRRTRLEYMLGVLKK